MLVRITLGERFANGPYSSLQVRAAVAPPLSCGFLQGLDVELPRPVVS
jgi:hypothetical protein